MKKTILLSVLLLTATRVLAQTVATGDSRTVTQPVIPPICSQLAATKFIAKTTAVNIDPYNTTCGSTGGTRGTLGCTGGTSYEPSSSASSYVASEGLDNTAVQAALNACPAGQAVEITAGASGQLGLVLSPWHLPSGVSIVLDPDVTLFASRNRTDYGGTNCGLVTTGSSSCNHWLTAPNTTGSGIYGFGTLDGRGWDAYIGSTTAGFYSNRIQAYCNNHGGAIDNSPACTTNSSGNNSYGPNLLNLVNANSFTLYGVTLKDSGNFVVNWQSSNGFTAWDAKIIVPEEVSNTDGFDPLNSTNGTWTHGYISNGDNQMAVKSTTAPAGNITVSFTQTGGGVGFTEGTDQAGGISNILVTDIVQNGNLNDVRTTGLMIASSTKNGGLVNQITYRRACIMNESNPLRFYTNYDGETGSDTPIYNNLYLKDITVLPSTAPYTTGNSGKFTFQGLSGNPIKVWLDNVQIQGTNQGVAQQSSITKDQYTTAVIGPGTVSSSLLSQFSAGTSVTTSGSSGSTTAYACTASMWKPLIGELNLQTPSSTYSTSYSPSSATPYTLQAVLEPATAVNIKESAPLTQPVQFLDNGVLVGSAALTGNGTLAQLTISSSTPGAHVYQAQYPGDSNYAAFSFGSVTVTNPGVAPPPSGITPCLSGSSISLSGANISLSGCQ